MAIELISVKEKLEHKPIKPPEPVVGGLLFRGSMAVLGAPDDSLKTNWALQLAISLTAGIDCYSYSCKKSVVAYFILEGGQDYILERLEEKIAAMRLDRDEVMSRIYTIDCSQWRLDDPNIIKQIETALYALNPIPDVVVFDPITYALSEDVRFSPEKTKLCMNLLRIADSINGVTLAVIHCRKGAKDDNNMDDFLGSGVMARAAATRIKLHRNGDTLTMYIKTRYAERPDATYLSWKHPLLEVMPETLKPKEESKRAVIEFLKGKTGKEARLGDLVSEVATLTKHNPKTVRAAISNLQMVGKVTINPMPKSAIKIVKLVDEETLHAS